MTFWRLRNVILLELKGMRIYKIFILINLVVLPFSYAFVLLLAGAEQDPSYVLSGLVVASLVSTFVTLLAHRVSNLVEPHVLELYAVFPVSLALMVVGAVVAYALIVFPQVAIFMGLTIWFAHTGKRAILAVPGMFLCLLFLASLGVFLGTQVRNPFKAQGLFPLLSWILILTAPVYYQVENLPKTYVILILLNPLTHVLNVIRSPLGFVPILNTCLSLGVLVVVGGLASLYAFRRLKNIRMLEQYF